MLNKVKRGTPIKRRQLIASVQLDHTHILARAAIAADESDGGNSFGSELQLVDALYSLRSLRWQVRNTSELGFQALLSHFSAQRILILTNIAVLHQRRGESKTAKARYQQVRELSSHLLGGHRQLLVHARWCEVTNSLADLTNRSGNIQGKPMHSNSGDMNSGHSLHCDMEVSKYPCLRGLETS